MALLVSGTTWYCSPVGTRHGYRTRDQPPTREARRNGCCVATAPEGADPVRNDPRIRKTRSHKKPASPSGAGAVAGSRRLSQGRRRLIPPLGISGQRASLCCALLLWLDSLSSAATSVGAKPNHGFFNCQHPDAKNLRGRRRRRRRRTCVGDGVRAARTARARAHPRDAAHESTFFQTFRANASARRVVRVGDASTRATTRGRAAEGVSRLSDARRAHARLRRRTSPFAQNCANFFRLARRFAPRRAVPRSACAASEPTRFERRRVGANGRRRRRERPEERVRGDAADAHPARSRRTRRPETTPAARGGRWQRTRRVNGFSDRLPRSARRSRRASAGR